MIFDRYVCRLVWQYVVIILAGFVGLFALFDLINELEEIGKGSYGIPQALAFIGLRLPGMAYEVFPLSALIGGLWALSQVAASSEFTVARASGFTPAMGLRMVGRAGLPLVLLVLILSEVVLPVTEAVANNIRLSSLGRSNVSALQTGFWLRDRPAEAGVERMVNVQGGQPSDRLMGVTVYEFDDSRRLRRVLRAEGARVGAEQADGQQVWTLDGVVAVQMNGEGMTQRSRHERLELSSALGVGTLGALLVRPEQMSAYKLAVYARYLDDGKLKSKVYWQAFWRKVAYPLSVWVMLVLALPAAYLQARAGSVGPKVFVGILLGIGFTLLNSFFSHLGALTTWPAPLLAAMPGLMALALGLGLFWMSQRRPF